MKRRSFVALCSTLAAATTLLVAGGGAAHAVGAGAVLTNGTIAYDHSLLSPAPTPASYTFNGTLGGYAAASNPGGVAIGTNNCVFTGVGTESLAIGQGTTSGYCNPVTPIVGIIRIVCEGSYNRAALAMSIVLNCTIWMTDGSTHHAIEICNHVLAPVDTAMSNFFMTGECKEIALD